MQDARQLSVGIYGLFYGLVCHLHNWLGHNHMCPMDTFIYIHQFQIDVVSLYDNFFGLDIVKIVYIDYYAFVFIKSNGFIYSVAKTERRNNRHHSSP